jgi:hypothetical protein
VIVERCEIKGPPKLILMNRATLIASKLKADWFIYLDADEYIILNKFNGVKDMLSKYYFTDALSLNWLMFGTNNHILEPEGLIMENYNKSDIILNQHVKTFVRPSQVSLNGATNPHFYHINNTSRWFAITGELMEKKVFNPINRPYWKTPAFIAHYVYQSEQTYKNRKLLLPSDDTGKFRQEETDIHAHHNVVENKTTAKYIENIKLFLRHFSKNGNSELGLV